MSITKNWIQYGVLMALTAVGITAVVESSGSKKLEQKIVMTQDHLSTVRSWANTYAGLTPTKDFTGINIETMGAKGIINLPIIGTGATATVNAPYDNEMSFAVTPVTGNKRFTIAITQSSNTPMDAIEKQLFEDMINSWATSVAGTVGGYTATTADGNISVTFGN